MDPFTLLSVGLIGIADYEDDKKMHLATGTALSVAAQEYDMSPLETCLLSLGAGLAKEAWDSRGHGNVELADVAATAFGCRLEFRF